MSVPYENEINEWMKSFEALPPERQENLKKWFATQKIILENAGLTPEEWFGYVQWAMDNPFDYGFIRDFPDAPEAGPVADAAERSDATRDARKLVGGTTAAAAPDGPGLKSKATSDKGLERELFNRFMRDRLGGGGRK